MAIRPVFVVKENTPYFRNSNVEFEWNGGFSKSQKQKNINAIHCAFKRSEPDKKVLEISSKSMQKGGELLSAFFLKKYVPSLGKSVPVECVFQAGKVFENGGPYLDLLEKTPREAKRDERLKTSGKLIRFEFEGKSFPLIPKTAFYDFIYICARFENVELTKVIMEYDAFTDIEFNPEKSINCQAKAAATFVSLSRMGLIDHVNDFEKFISLYGLSEKDMIKKTKTHAETEKVVEKKQIPTVSVGDIIIHKKYGSGEVLQIQDSAIKAKFVDEGEKALGLEWCLKNCQFERKKI